jgi:hypothetical protein
LYTNLAKASSVKIFIYATHGSKVFEKAFNAFAGANTFEIINLGYLSKGVYVVTVITDDFVEIKKVVKE